MNWAYSLSGLIVGFIVGLTGMGGGSLMTPLLVLFFGVPPATAVGTDLLYASITKAGGAWVHARRGNVDWNVVRLLAAGSLPTALITVWVLTALKLDSGRFAALISDVLGVALILTALALLFHEQLRQLGRTRDETTGRSRARLIPFTLATGIALGALVTLSSVGAGAIGLTVLLWLYPRLAPAKIVGSDIAHAVPLTAAAGLGHFYMGSVDFTLLGYLLIGSLPGIYLGSHLSSRFPEKVLRPTLATMLLLIGGRLIL